MDFCMEWSKIVNYYYYYMRGLEGVKAALNSRGVTVGGAHNDVRGIGRK